MMEFLTYTELHFIYLLVFSTGLSFGLGSSVLGGMLFLTVVKNKKISNDEYNMIKNLDNALWAGFLLYSFAGVGLFTLAYESMLNLEIFYASMTIAIVLIVNMLFFHFYHIPQIKKASQESKIFLHGYILISGAISVSSWLFLMLHHLIYRSEVRYFEFMIYYVFSILIILFILIATRKNILEKQDIALIKKAIFIVVGILILFNIVGILSKQDATNEYKENEPEINLYSIADIAKHNNVEDCWVSIDDMVFDATVVAEKYPEIYSCGEDVTEEYRKVTPNGISERMMKYQIGFIGYSSDNVASHNDNKKDCWLIIDEFVFDATKESSLHPAAFNCGTDASSNYHKNHGNGISKKMMQYQIGRVMDDTDVADELGVSEEEAIQPYEELYVKKGSWNTKNLMVIVEKDAEKLLFMDGSTNKEIGRINDIGFQPHTSVFSPNAKYMYIIARNGWLTKIDLGTLEPVKSIKVGINSRGTALTDDGKYLAIGNYEPGNIVIVDPVSMRILKKIPTTGEIDGKQIESRVGAMIEDGDKIIAALKDLNSVWVIDTSRKDFPVIEKIWNIGNNKTPLHDAFLTPDGKFFIVASMGSDTVWVMDTDTWKEVAEVKTGKTPHTGPGATWGDNVYVPAMGEGLITVINTKTWEPIKYIKTSGPGLFVRAFNKNPNYPYVWAETAFGDYNDEIYVIDARINEIVKTIVPVKGESSWHPEFTNDGAYVYVVSQSANEIEIYDALTFELIKRIKSDTPSAVSSVGNRIEERGL